MDDTITPGISQHFADGDCRRMPPGKWLIHGFKARPEGCDELIVVTMRRRGVGTVVCQFALLGRRLEVRPWFDEPVKSRGDDIEFLVQEGAAWIEVNAEKMEWTILRTIQ